MDLQFLSGLGVDEAAAAAIIEAAQAEADERRERTRKRAVCAINSVTRSAVRSNGWEREI